MPSARGPPAPPFEGRPKATASIASRSYATEFIELLWAQYRSQQYRQLKRYPKSTVINIAQH